MSRSSGLRITARQIAQAKRTASKEFSLLISDEQARRILEIDRSLLSELNDSGDLDTLPREDFGAAIVEMILPGKPSVQDDLISQELECWHWPCNGSSGRYKRAFAKAFKAALAAHGIRTATD